MTRRLKSDFTATRWSPGNAYIKAANEAALQHSDQAGVDQSLTELINQTTRQPSNHTTWTRSCHSRRRHCRSSISVTVVSTPPLEARLRQYRKLRIIPET